jgi:PAS domain S-box-containing protein
LRGIFDAAKESIWLFDTDMAVLAANVSAIKRLGVPIEELIGKPIDRFLPEELALSRRAHLKRTVESAQPMEFEDERSGMLFHHCLYPIVNAEGRVTSVVCYSQDITERNRTEETLRASEEKYRRLLEDASDAIFVADGETGMLLEANRQATVLTGWSASELKGMYQRELHPPEESETFSATFMEHIASPGKTVEALVHHKDGRDIPVEITANTFTLNGRLVLQGIFRNVTERRQARHAQKLEAIGTLAGGIAHDFNNILSPIIGYTEMIMDEIPESSPSRYDINQVLIAANRAKELVKGSSLNNL